ncbi:glycosyltransferase family 2 protein [Geminocystis sp. NIES-3708]|uniref:glycosyltransferase family 2 protein n=1 Tax=Geminocystis sp. NIES-3708 TaxID=1615909 RepID=UPI001E300590|nr:glycosyltransferase family 2 protein [Geminocystis sp. NIES-3708]
MDVVYSYYHQLGKTLRFFASNNFALSRFDFLDLGGFNESFYTSEDQEFCDRWLQKGFDLKYVPSTLVYHDHYLTLDSFWRQHFNYGRGAFRFYQSRVERGLHGLKIEPQFYQKLITYSFYLEFFTAILLKILVNSFHRSTS